MSLQDLEVALKIGDAFEFMSREEIHALYELARRFIYMERRPVFLNVGAGVGTSGLALRAGCPHADIYTVDCSTGGPLGGLENERNAFSNSDLKLPTQILGESHLVAKSWAHGQIDLAFIDDGHTEPYIRGDIEGWFPFVRSGGIMVYHDYDHEFWPDVKVVVDEHMGRFTQLVKERYLVAYLIAKDLE